MAENDEQDFLESLSAIPNHVLSYTVEFTEACERRVDDLAVIIREKLSSSTWIPQSARPSPRPQKFSPIHLLPPQSFGQRVYNLVYEYRAAIAAITAFAATGGIIYYREKRNYLQKRRAKRGANGSRQEVVVVAGSPSSPIPRTVALDLERRGFIVYLVVDSHSDEEKVRKEARKDLHPLHMDITNALDVRSSLERFAAYFTGSSPGLRFSGFILVPDPVFTPGPIETVSPDIFADTFNTRLVHSIATTQAFLPLIISNHTRLLVLTPAITSSLRLPFSSLESTSIAALEGFIGTLTAEMRTVGVNVCHVKLGNLNLDQLDRTAVVRNGSSETLSWPATARQRYGQKFLAMTDGRTTTRGSPLRELHNKIFDAISQDRSPRGVIYVGRGSFLYPVFGSWMPQNLVAWMLGYYKA